MLHSFPLIKSAARKKEVYKDSRFIGALLLEVSLQLLCDFFPRVIYLLVLYFLSRVRLSRKCFAGRSRYRFLLIFFFHLAYFPPVLAISNEANGTGDVC